MDRMSQLHIYFVPLLILGPRREMHLPQLETKEREGSASAVEIDLLAVDGRNMRRVDRGWLGRDVRVAE